MLSRAGANRLCMKGFILNGRKRVDNVTVVLQESKIKLREATYLVRVLIPGKLTAPSQIFLFYKYMLSAF